MKKNVIKWMVCLLLATVLLGGNLLPVRAEAATHSHPICGQVCTCSSSSHGSDTWQAWDGTTKMYNGYYYLTKDIVLSSRIILDYGYTTYLCLNGHSITCSDMVFDIYSYRSLLITDCVGTGKIERTNGSPTISNNRYLSIWGGTILNSTNRYSSTINAYNGTTTFVCGGTVKNQYGSAIYAYPGSTISILGGTVQGGGSSFAALEGHGSSASNVQSSLTISGGHISAESEHGTVDVQDGDFTMTGGYVDGHVDVFDSSGSTRVSGGTINGYLYSYSQDISITGGDMALETWGNTSISGGTFRDTCYLGAASTTITGGNFTACDVVDIQGEAQIKAGTFSLLRVDEKPVYLSSIPTITDLQILRPNTVIAQNSAGSESFLGSPITIRLDHPYSDTIWKDGDVLIKNVFSDAVAAKFSLAEESSYGKYLERSGSNLVLRTLPHGTWGSNASWIIEDGTLTISGTGALAEEHSGTRYPWYQYADKFTTIVVEPGITKIPPYAFEYLEAVHTIRLPDTLTDLSLHAFQDCGSLNNLLLPASLTAITGSSNTFNPTFIRCESLTDLYYMGTKEEWTALTQENPVTSANSDMTVHFLTYYPPTASCTEAGTLGYYQFDDTSVYNSLYNEAREPISQLVNLPALGHRVYLEGTTLISPLRVENTDTIPFLLTDGTYYSNNHTHSSSSQLKIVAEQACTLKLVYGVSSESNYDKLFILHNGTQKASISGSISNKTMTLTLAAGDTVTVRYTKDGSSSKNQDQGWVTLEYDWIEAEGSGDVPAHLLKPDCVNAVVCDYCGTVVKEALGHSLDTENICTRCGTATGTCGDSVNWELSPDGTLTIFGTGSMKSYCSINKFYGATISVDYLSKPWNVHDVTKLIVKDGVTNVSNGAFWTVTGSSMTEVTLADSVTAIGDYTFYEASGLTEFTVPKNVTYIGEFAFEGSSNLSTITFQGGAPSIQKNSFTGVTATCYYPYGDPTWTADKLLDYGGDLTWIPTIPTGKCGDNLTWKLVENGTLTISGTGEMYDFDEEEGLYAPWYDFRESITKLVIENGATTIGNYAFHGCKNLATVSIPDSVELFGAYAFWGCNSLQAIKIPESQPIIFGYTFSGCSSLTSITIPEGVQRIGERAFAGSGLTSITIPDSVTFIGNYAFKMCTDLTEVRIGKGVKTLGEQAFGYCSALETAWFAGDAPYSGASNVFAMSGNTAYYPSHLESWTESARKVICSYANWVPYDLCEQGHSYGADDICTVCGKIKPLASGQCGEAAYWELDVNGKLTITGTGTTYDYARGKAPWASHANSITALAVESSITRLGNYTFADCINLTEVSLPDTLTSIGSWTFINCAALAQIRLPEGLASLDNAAFQDCKKLATVTLPDSLERIGSHAFMACKALEAITLPENLQFIGHSAFSFTGLQSIHLGSAVDLDVNPFSGCDSLAQITVEQDNPYVCANGNILFSKDETELVCYPGGLTAECYTVPTGVETIGDFAIYSHKYLTAVELPDTLTTIDGYAFYDSKLLTQLELPSGLTHIGSYAFCFTSPDSLVIPETVTYIGDRALGFHSKHLSVTFEGSAPEAGDEIFYSCQADAYYPLGDETWTEAFRSSCGGTVNWIPSCGDHTFEATYQWAEDHSSCTGTYFCTTDGCEVRSSETVNSTLVTKDPDCITDGSKVYTAEFTAPLTTQIYTVILEAGGHKEVIDPAVAPNCSNSGWTEGSHCGVCGQVLVAQQALPANGIHTYVNLECIYCGMVGGTCGENLHWTFNKMTQKLTITGSGAMDDYEWEGAPWRDYLYEIKEAELPEGLTHIGAYAFGNAWNMTDVNVPDSVRSLGHGAFCSTAITEITIPEGVTALPDSAFLTCALEEISLPSTLTEIGPHAFGGSALKDIAIPAAVVKIGEGAFAGCTSLTSILVPTAVMEVGAEAFANATNVTEVWFTSVAPTMGERMFAGLTITAYYPGVESTWTEAVRQNYGGTVTWVPVCYTGHEWRDATCETPKACWYCGQTEGEALGHQYESVVTPPTCTEDGYTTHTCAACGDKFVDSPVSALGHSMSGWNVTLEPTCTESGMERNDCARCDFYEEREAEALGHQYESVVTPPTCTEDGYTTHTCAACGDKFVDSPVSALGHSMSGWNVTLEPTCTESGMERNDCARCDYHEEREAEALGHRYQYALTQEPTLTEEGLLEISCAACTEEWTVILPKLDTEHYDYVVTAEPTYTEAGTATYTWKENAYGPYVFEVTLAKLPILFGDVNDDGKVNTKDRILLTRYLAGWEGYDAEDVNLLAADVNQDGAVNTKDRIILTRYLANWTGYEELPYQK